MAMEQKYKLIGDYHMHTVASDGRAQMYEMIEAGINLGLEEIAISDHAPGHMAYGIRDLPAYLDGISKMQERFAGKIKIFRGIELNLLSLDGATDLPDVPFDVRILGFHKTGRPKDLASAFHFFVKRMSKREKTISKTTDAYIKAMERSDATIIAHPGYAIAVDISALANACKQTGVLFELNGSHSGMTEQMIEQAAAQGPKFILSSDSHSPNRVGDCGGILKKALNVGLTSKEIINLRLDEEVQ